VLTKLDVPAGTASQGRNKKKPGPSLKMPVRKTGKGGYNSSKNEFGEKKKIKRGIKGKKVL